MYEVRRLRLLRELAAHGTIAAVAEVCNLTPSAVSQQLSLLEREVRTPLLIRDGRRLVLTEAARILVASTERVLAEMERASADVAALSQSVRGTLRLVAFPTAASALAAPAIAECQADHPDLRILLGQEEPEKSVPGLRAQRADMALVYEYSLLSRIHDAGVELRPLLQEPVQLAVPPGRGQSPAGESCPLTLADLREERWIAPTTDSALRLVLERACQASGFSPQFYYTSDDYTVIAALVQAGLGVSLIPRLAADQLAADVELHPVDGLRLTRTVSVAVRAGSAADPAIAAMTQALVRVSAGPGLSFQADGSGV